MRELQADRGTPLTRPADSASAAPGDPRDASADGQPPAETDAPDVATGAVGDSEAVAETEAAGETDAPGDSGKPAVDAEAPAEGTTDVAAPAGSGTRRGRWLFALVALLTLAADVISKLVVVTRLEDTNHPPVEVLGNVLYLVHTRNTGAAFSLGSGYTYVLTAIAVGVIVVIIRSARKLASTGWALALGLVLGGACGNVVDRLFREGGGVVDFLALIDPFDPPWPVFNLADSALCVGVAIIVGLELTGRRIDGTRVTKSGRAQSKDD
ncbi:signal peptidase II [Cryptosporangium minutisporangium]|uniref:Lipoprotein signal peptidase n=1 Tax=Cryptosporangium minutisporangium TaxID=113569 RepID=A0ABP6T0A8_9ACTN